MAYGSGFGNNLPPWKPMAMQTPPPVPSTAAPGPISSYNAGQLRMLQGSNSGQMPAGGAARPPVSQQVPINNSVGQMTPRSAGLGGSVSPRTDSLSKFDNFLRPNMAFQPQATVNTPGLVEGMANTPRSMGPLFSGSVPPSAYHTFQANGGVLPPEPPKPVVNMTMSGDPRSTVGYSMGGSARTRSPGAPFEMPTASAVGEDASAARGLPRFAGFTNSAAVSDLGRLGSAAKTVGGAVFGNPVVNNPLTRTALRVAAPVGALASGASAMTDKSGYQDPVERALGIGNLHDRIEAGNKAWPSFMDVRDPKAAAYYAATTIPHAAYAATVRPLVEATEWAYNKFNPVSSAAAQPTSPPGSPPPTSPPPAAPPAVQPPAAAPSAAAPSAPGRQPSLSEQYPGRFSGVPSFRDVVSGAADSRKIPLTAQEQNYNAEVLRGMQLENRSRELANVDRYRATQLKDPYARATLAASDGRGLGQGLEREQFDPEGKNDLMQQKLNQLDQRTSAVTSALFDPNDTDSANKINRARQLQQKLNAAREAFGLPAQTLEEMVQSNYGRTYDPKTGYFAKPK